MGIRSLADADARAGGKAAGLARLVAAGLPVPPGFVIDAAPFLALVGDAGDAPAAALGHALAAALARVQAGPLPAALVDDVAARAAALGELAVRSSATLEDGAEGAAAGVFSSRRAVPAAEVWPAVREVWASALAPLAAAYARRRGGALALGVIVQRFVHGEAVTVYTRPPGEPGRDEAWVQRGGALRRTRRDDPAPEVQLALRAEAALALAGGADVELVLALDGAWVVQARPVLHPRPAARRPAPPAVTAALVADGRRWTWDVAHNPDPLSPAQQGLVELVERAGVAPWSMRVCGGYLYVAATDAPTPVAPASAEELWARARALEAELEAALDAPAAGGPATAPAARPGTPAPGATARVDAPIDLADALARYLACYRVWARELSPLIAAARSALPRALRARGWTSPALEREVAALVGARPSAVEACLAAAARGELGEDEVAARLGALAPCWDVAAPTFAERPGLLADAVARARLAVATAAVRGDGETLATPDVGPPPSSPAGRAGAPPADLGPPPSSPAGRAGAAPLVDAGRAVTTDRAAPGASPGPTTPAVTAGAGATAQGSDATRRPPPGTPPDDLAGPIALARVAADLAERDDAVFARAQRMVRDALRARGRALDLEEDDAFWLPLDELVAAPALDREAAHRRAGAARAAAARAARWEPPLVVGGPPAPAGGSLRGVGTGGRASGRVVRYGALADAVAPAAGDVIVTRAITPALAVLVVGCAAIVSETGGLLDHGAAMARELAVPCVVGCAGAWRDLADGALVEVDADAGEVRVVTVDAPRGDGA